MPTPLPPRLALTALLFLGGWAALRTASAEPPSRLAQSRQLLVVTSDGWDADHGQLQRFARPQAAAGSRWQAVGRPLAVWLGRSGLAWRSDEPPPSFGPPGPRKREGDGRAPAGIFGLGQLWGYAAAAPAQVRLPYTQSDPDWRCVDDPESGAYNQLVRAPTVGSPTWRSAEALRLPSDHYKYLVVIDYNRRPPQPGAGSCIFLHVAPPPGAPTAGCTALAEPDLLTVLRWLDPKQQPLLVALPRSVGAAAAIAWDLPPALFAQ